VKILLLSSVTVSVQCLICTWHKQTDRYLPRGSERQLGSIIHLQWSHAGSLSGRI